MLNLTFSSRMSSALVDTGFSMAISVSTWNKWFCIMSLLMIINKTHKYFYILFYGHRPLSGMDVLPYSLRVRIGVNLYCRITARTRLSPIQSWTIESMRWYRRNPPPGALPNFFLKNAFFLCAMSHRQGTTHRPRVDPTTCRV